MPADPEQGSFVLNDYPRDMEQGSSVSLVSSRLVACQYDTCEIYLEGSWEHLQDVKPVRLSHSSATTEEAVLLIGGMFSKTSEWIPVDGSVAQTSNLTGRVELSKIRVSI